MLRGLLRGLLRERGLMSWYRNCSKMWADPGFRACLAFAACVIAFLAVCFITEWESMRDEARRERHIRKNRWWDK